MATMNIISELENCAAALERGELVPERLRDAAARLRNLDGLRQSLLYLQSLSTDVESQLLGYTLVVNGKRIQGADNPDDWPYQSVADAIRDGWRIISFPDTTLLMDESRSYGLGCDFVLEKMEIPNDK